MTFIRVTEIDVDNDNQIIEREIRINTHFIIEYHNTKVGEVEGSWIRTEKRAFAVWESPETLDNLIGTVGICKLQ